MSRIASTFDRLRAAGETALIPFVTAGDPDLDTTAELIVAMAGAGADLVEIGVPFSDPIAEGPTIQRASERALANGITLRRILEMVKRVRAEVEVPLLLMGYANPFLTMGPEGFAEAAREVGVDGVICPDLPPEEGAELAAALESRGIDMVLLVAPNTTDARLAMLCERSRGFVYYVSLKGVTSARNELAQGIGEGVKRIRAHGDLPVCVGFGVSTPEHAASIAAFADGVIVGSAIVDRIEAASGRAETVASVVGFISELKAPLRG